MTVTFTLLVFVTNKNGTFLRLINLTASMAPFTCSFSIWIVPLRSISRAEGLLRADISSQKFLKTFWMSINVFVMIFSGLDVLPDYSRGLRTNFLGTLLEQIRIRLLTNYNFDKKRNSTNYQYNRQQTTFSFIDVQYEGYIFLILCHRDSHFWLGNKIYNFFYNCNHHLLNDLIFQSIQAPEPYVFTPEMVTKTLYISNLFHVSLVFDNCMYNEYSDSYLNSPQESYVKMIFQNFFFLKKFREMKCHTN